MHFNYSPLYIALFLAHTSSYAQVEQFDELINKQLAHRLQPIFLQAQEREEVGEAQYNAEEIKQMPNASKSISDFLKLNPSVQFGRDAESAGKQASLAAEEISINGAPSFSNKFVVDGVNTSNTFDPVGELADSNYYGFPANSQTANINTDLICQLSVVDSNASAEHGQFQGGVISAQTCAPKTQIGKLHGTLQYDYTTANWSRFNYVDSAEELKYETDQDADHPKEYTTQGLSASIYGKVNEAWGFNAFASRRNSRIPVLSGFTDTEKIKTQEQNDNVGLTLYFNPTEQDSYQLGVQHFNYDKEGYYKNVIGSNYDVQTLTDSIFLNAQNRFDQFSLTQNLNFRRSQLNRQVLNNSSTIWYYAEGSKDWRDLAPGESLTEGGFGGNLINQESQLSYDVKAQLQDIHLGSTKHRFKIGGGYQHHQGSWERPDEMFVYTTRANLGASNCALGDLQCDEADLIYRPNSNSIPQTWTGQYSRAGTYYAAGKFTARQDLWSAFAEDEIQWKNVKARLGLRTDYDSLASNINIAPRLYFEYRPFNDDHLRLSTGINRYYGTTFLITELDEKAYGTQASLSRAASYSTDWSAENEYGWLKNFPNTVSTAAVRASDLKTPYSDELMFALDGQFNRFDWGLKWVHRDFKDQVFEQRVFKTNTSGMEVLDYRTYSNTEGGEADTFTLSLNTHQPFTWLSTEHNIGLALSYLEQNTKKGSYKTADSNAQHDFVYLNGDFVQYNQLPTTDAPFTARLNWNIKGKDIPFNLNHFFYFRDGSINYVKTQDEIEFGLNRETVPIYEAQKFASKFRWDTRLTYDYQLAKDQHLIFGLTVNNVLNKANKAVTESGSAYSEEGRRFIADVSYKF